MSSIYKGVSGKHGDSCHILHQVYQLFFFMIVVLIVILLFYSLPCVLSFVLVASWNETVCYRQVELRSHQKSAHVQKLHISYFVTTFFYRAPPPPPPIDYTKDFQVLFPGGSWKAKEIKFRHSGSATHPISV